MFLKSMQQRQRTSQTIDTFGGYCHKEVIDNAQWYDMKNMSADKFPAITTRSKRITVDSVSGEPIINPVAIIDKDGLVWIDSAGTLHAGEHSIPNFVPENSKDLQMISMGANLIVWPLRVWANIARLKTGETLIRGEDYGGLSTAIEQKNVLPELPVTDENSVKIFPCKEDGEKWDFFPHTLHYVVEKKEDLPKDANPYEYGYVTGVYPYEEYLFDGSTWEFKGYYNGYYSSPEEPNQSETLIENPPPTLPPYSFGKGFIWQDTSEKPYKMKKWDGEKWDELQNYVRIEFSGIEANSESLEKDDAVNILLPERIFETEKTQSPAHSTSGYYKPIDNEVELENPVSVIDAGEKFVVSAGYAPGIVIIPSYHSQLVKCALYASHHQASPETAKEEEYFWTFSDEELLEYLSRPGGSGNYGYTAEYQRTVVVEFSVPDMDYVIECGNRLWGCFYGTDKNGKILNEIYGSQLGKFKNWNVFAGLSTDSYAASRGSDGPWTGAVSYNNYPLFFKRNSMDKLYISSSGAHQIVTTQMQGIQPGSWKSAKIIDGILYYMSDDGIMSYDGSLPNLISDCLGRERYENAVAGVYDYKYCISMKNIASGMCEFFVFDTKNGVAVKHDNTKLISAVESGTSLYMLCEENKINVLKCVNADSSVAGEEEEDFTWHLESSAIGIVDSEHKYARRFTIRMKLPPGSAVEILLKYDNSNEWLRQIKYFGSGLRSFSIPVRPRRCDHFFMKIVGIGEATIYSINREIDGGSVE